MKKNNSHIKLICLTLTAIIVLSTVYVEAFAGDEFTFAKSTAANRFQVESIQTGIIQKQRKNKKSAVKQKTMNTKITDVPTGIWGGTGLILTVEEKGGSIQYECADGQIEQTLKVNAQGNFSAKGTHTPQRGGPIRVDSKLAGQPVLYEGKVSGNTMTLRVTLTETKEVIGEFTLERGVTPRLHRCY